MKIFIICPVRLGIVPEIMDYVKKLEEEGHEIIYPPRDTEQEDSTGYNICAVNAEHIKSSDRVDIFYDARSQGQHFDLGVTFASGIPIKLVKILVPYSSHYGADQQTGTKSFPNMLKDREKRNARSRK